MEKSDSGELLLNGRALKLFGGSVGFRGQGMQILVFLGSFSKVFCGFSAVLWFSRVFNGLSEWCQVIPTWFETKLFGERLSRFNIFASASNSPSRVCFLVSFGVGKWERV